MAAGRYETSNLGWQLRLLGQRIWEWVELQFSRGNSSPSTSSPTSMIPPWLVQTTFWLLLTMLLVWLGWQLYQTGRSYWRRRSPKASSESLARLWSPSERSLSASSWWERSQQLQQRGQYRDACRALYMAMLQQLRDQQLIPRDESLTDGDYLTLIQHLPQSQLYRLLISTHERLYFGGAAVSAEWCDRCRRAYEEIAAQ